MHRTTGDASKRTEALSGATGSSSARTPSDDGSSRLVEDQSAGTETFPTGGRHVWIPPNGPPREVEPGAGPAQRAPDSADELRSCPECEASRSIETLVREHADCGYVGIDGFLGGAASQTFSCPKCDAVADGEVADGDYDASEAFSVVGTVFSCLECGRVLDRPLGPGIDGDP